MGLDDLVIPKSVGGNVDFVPTTKVAADETRISELVIPASVGGDVVADPQVTPTPSPQPEVTPAQPLSQIVPEVAQAATQAVQQISVPDTGLADIVTGSERIAATPELGTLPEFATTEEGDTFRIAIGLLSTFDEKAQRDMIQEAIPEAVFDITPDGSTIIEVPKEGGGTRRSVLNRPGLSPRDFATGLAQILAFLPTSRFAGAAKSLGEKVLRGFVGAGATEQTLQEVGVELGRQERDPVSTGIAAVTGGAAEVVLPAIQAVRQGRQAARVGAERAEIEEVRKAIVPAQEALAGLREATGADVGLFPAQQTLRPSELLKQRILPQLDAGAKKSAEALSKQNEEVFRATTELIETVAPEGRLVGGAGRFKKVAEDSIRNAKKVRSAAVKPLYDEAFKAAKESAINVDLKPVADFVETELVGLVDDDPAAIALKSFMKRLQGEKLPGTPEGLIQAVSGKPLTEAAKGELKPLSLEQLQSAKFTTDAAIDRMGGITLNSAQKNAKRLISQAEKLYIDQLGELSPQFAAANRKFAELSPAIDELENSILGEAVKVSDDKLRNIAQTIFNPKESSTNPSAIRKARSVIDSIDPDAWNDLLRVEINRRMAGIKQLTEDLPELVGNEPGQIKRALFGNKSQREVLLAGMNKEQKKNFVFLENVLRRAESGRAAGSPTAAFGQAIEKLKGVAVVLRDTVFRPLRTLQELGESTLFDRNVANLTEVMFNPKFEPQLSKLRKLNPDSPAAARAMTQLLNDIGKEDSNDEN